MQRTRKSKRMYVNKWKNSGKFQRDIEDNTDGTIGRHRSLKMI